MMKSELPVVRCPLPAAMVGGDAEAQRGAPGSRVRAHAYGRTSLVRQTNTDLQGRVSSAPQRFRRLNRVGFGVCLVCAALPWIRIAIDLLTPACR